MRIAWKTFYFLGFILILIFSGCGDRQPSIDELVVQAESLTDEGQIESAILILERCNERDPTRVDVLEALAFAYAAEGDSTLASMTFLRIAEIVPQRPEYLLYAAESLLEASDNKGAVSQYEAYLQVRPEDRAVWVILADLQNSLGRVNESLEAFLTAENVEPRAQQRIRIGELYLRKNNLAQAQSWFAQALEGDSEVRDEALLGLLETAVRSRRFADAEGLLERIDAEYPGRLEQSPIDNVRDQLKVWRQRQDAASVAVAALDNLPRPGRESPEVEEALQFDSMEMTLPDPPVTTSWESASPPSSTSESDFEREETVEEPVVQGPTDSAAMDDLRRARSLRTEGSIQEAIRHYKKALVLNDNQPAVWAELSEAYLEAGYDRWAQATASEAMRRDSEDPKLVLQFLRAAQNTMNGERLIHEMEAAYRKFPDVPEVALVLARAYADDGNLRNARLLYRKLLRLVPEDHPIRSNVQEELRRIGG